MIKIKFSWSIIVAVVLWVTCLSVGTWLSERKPLWNDEIYTQIYSIEQLSYRDILSGRIKEGNNSPLFYLLQKGICDLTQYRFPQKWDGEWSIGDQRSQIILRLSSNVFMSLSIVLIFYFFAHYYSGWAGLYALLVSLSSFMVWSYWVEARPYSLWILLTTVQSLLFLNMVQREKPETRCWTGMTVTHILLSVTVVFGIAQIMIVSFLLWMSKEKKYKKYFLLTGIPVCLCLFYCLHSPSMRFRLVGNPLQFIYDNVPQERLLVFILYAFFSLMYRFHKDKRMMSLRDTTIGLKGGNYLALTSLMLLAVLAVLVIFKINSAPGMTGFEVTSRYFINLTPIGIIAMTLFSVHFIRAFKGQVWMLTNIVIVLGGVLIMRVLGTCLDVMALRLY